MVEVTMAGPIKGLKQAGNVNLYTVPHVINPDTSQSTVRSLSFGEDDKEILIPGINRHKILSEQEAIKQYRQTGQHLGIFNAPQSANVYAKKLHDTYAAGKLDVPLATSKRSVDPIQLATVLKGLLKSGPYIDPYQVK